MNVSDLQRQLLDLADFLERMGAGAKVTNELSEASAALAPVAGKSIKDLASLLLRAEEFERTGKLGPPTRTRNSTANGKAKTSASKPDPSALAAETKSLYERAADPSVTEADIQTLAERLGTLKKAGIVSVAESLGLKGMKNKTQIQVLAEVRRMIEERKGAKLRSGMIHPHSIQGDSTTNADQMD